MAEKFSFFNAELIDGNYDRVYQAEDYASYFASFIGNGIYANPATNLKVIEEGMGVIVKAGKAWCNGYFYENTSDLQLQLEASSGSYARIDLIVVRLDLTNRYFKVFVKKGANAATPTAPSLIRNGTIYEMALAEIKVGIGAIEIQSLDITDLRFTDKCGVVSGLVDQIDTNGLFTQYNAEFESWFNKIKTQLTDNVAGALQNQINVLTESKANKEHNHDTSYYTKLEVDKKVDEKANSSHTHTKSQISDFPTSMPASDVSAWAKASTKPTYNASEVGALPAGGKAVSAGSADSAVNADKVDGLHFVASTTVPTVDDKTVITFVY